MNTRTAAWIAVPLCLLNIALGVLGFVFGVLNGYTPLELLNESAPGTILAVSISIVGALVASRRPENPLGWIFCVIGLSQGLVTFAYEYATYALITRPGALGGGSVMAWLGTWAWMPGLGLLLTFALLLFPDGRLPSPRWRWLAWLSAFDLALIVPIAILTWPLRGPELLGDIAPSGVTSGLFEILLAVVVPLMLVCGLASVISLIVRFRRSQGIERQQLKWFTYAAIATFSVLILSEVIGVATEFATFLLLPVVPSLPIAVGIAILRYRLWDLDRIIRRTLVYSVLTALLALIYFGGVVLLQGLLSAVGPLAGIFDSRRSEVVTVVSTLAIAALFFPLRQRVQNFIDRRFYRRKYNTAKTLTAFSATIRDEVELDKLTARLVDIVQETMQPESVSLWLRKPEVRK